MMKSKVVIYFVILSIFLISLINFNSAQIILTQPKEVYNIGDVILLNFSLSESAYQEGLLRIKLVCPSNETDLYIRYPLKINPGLIFNDFISQETLIEMKGNCFIQGNFKEEEERTSNFSVTDEIKISSDINKNNFKPSEHILIIGKAVKANSNISLGKGEIRFLDIKQNFVVIDGKFDVDLLLPSNAKPGNGEISIAIQEGANIGLLNKEITIAQVPTKIIINTSKDSFNPNENLTIRGIIYDQVLQIIQDNLSIRLSDSENKVIFDKIISSNNFVEYAFSSIAPAGDWKIEAYGFGINEKKFVTVREYKAVDIIMDNNTLVIKNIGNVIYDKPILINLTSTETGNQENLEIKNLNLSIDGQTSYKLEAPSANYDISVEGKTFRNFPLTGRIAAAIELTNKKEEGFLTRNPILVTVLFFGFFIVIIIFTFMSRIKHQIVLKPQKAYHEISTRLDTITTKLDTKITGLELERDKIKKIFSKYVGTNPVLIEEPNLRGKKQNVTALFIDMRGFSAMSEKIGPEKTVEMLSNYFKVVTNVIYSYGGVVNDIAGDGIFALFNNPQKEQYNELAAVKAAVKILDAMKKLGYNVGIGINSGEAIVGVIGSEKAVKFSAIGSSINIAQKLEEKAKNCILVTSKVYEKIRHSIKAERVGIFDIIGKPVEIYRIDTGYSGSTNPADFLK